MKDEEKLERDAKLMEEESERVKRHIDEARSDWESKEADPSVGGAQPSKESDQLPEEGPSEQVPDDDAGEVREEAERNPGVPGEEGTGTGNPGAAGAEDPDE